ncbi:MAG: hypothetical protein SHS37scaffold145_62 [Phage 71_18]|nr:MAG: hypothetical protein SHS37scaffold145_62 [Phage 71_18]
MPGDKRAAIRTRRRHLTILAALDPVVRTAEELDALRVGILAEFTSQLDDALTDMRDGDTLLTDWRFHRVDDQGRFVDTTAERQGPKANAWRQAVITRDGHACTRCGSTEELQAHHIKEWATHPADRYDVDNGVTLCRTCHQAVHHVA